MAHFFTNEEAVVHKENIAFYDEIANSYNHLLEKDNSNKIIRQKVKDKFICEVKSGWVLDFGGGTGIDLEWLTTGDYNILFCEPSVFMREQAIHYNSTILHNSTIIFLDDDKTDFTKWKDKIPFPQQVDGVLSNFGVINNIMDIEMFFRNLAIVTKSGSPLIATVLDLSFRKKWQWHSWNALRALIFGTPFSMYVLHETYKQTVFVHSLKKIKKAAEPYFNFRYSEFLGGFGFRLIHLTRK